MMFSQHSPGVRVQLLAMDVDGTLLTPDLHLTSRVVQAIAAARRAGVRVVLATGRMFASARPHAVAAGVDGPLIAYNGAMVCALDGKVLAHTPLPSTLAMELLAVAQEHDLSLNLYSNDTLYVRKMDEHAAFYMSTAQVEAQVLSDMCSLALAGCTKGLVIDAPAQAIAWEKLLAERFAGRLAVTRSNPQYVEIIAPTVSKGVALAALAAELGIAAGAVMAIGDSYNDLDMLTYAGIGVAMGNAPLEVQRRVGRVVGANSADGVAEAIERYILHA